MKLKNKKIIKKIKEIKSWYFEKINKIDKLPILGMKQRLLL